MGGVFEEREKQKAHDWSLGSACVQKMGRGRGDCTRHREDTAKDVGGVP